MVWIVRDAAEDGWMVDCSEEGHIEVIDGALWFTDGDGCAETVFAAGSWAQVWRDSDEDAA